MAVISNKIVLVGFMGTGKSTVARLLAGRLGIDSVDLDEEIERREGRKIADIFAQSGETAFRAVESRALETLLNRKESLVIATGGGAVLAEANRELMLRHGWVVALTAAAGQIIERVRHDTNRPLLSGGGVEDRVTALMEQRKHAYDFAEFKVDTGAMSAAEAADCILRQRSVGT